MNLSINLTSSQTLAVKDEEAATNVSLNLLVCQLIHSAGTSKLVWDPRPLLFLKTSFQKFLALFLQTFLAVSQVQPFGTGLTFPEPLAAVIAINTVYGWELCWVPAQLLTR